MRMIDIIERKKQGFELDKEQIEYFVRGITLGEIPDYQISALLMAITLKGMTDGETHILTQAMVNSGEVETRGDIDGIICDKHSTGGVSDSTTLLVMPILASLGIYTAKLSGRGLGFTGGTLDKLESFENFNVNLSKEQFFAAVKTVGAAISGQTAKVAPADKKLYALRDVTATVNSIPLIASSVMSKKLASFANCIMLDVKYGSGAFMKTKKGALKLAKAMVEIGARAGRKTAALITSMEQPLGSSVGCELEVLECLEILRGGIAKSDLLTVAVEICARILNIAKNIPVAAAKEQCMAEIDSGRAYDKLREIVVNQGGKFDILPKNMQKDCVLSPKSGIIKWINTENIGKAAVYLGGGRQRKDDEIDKSVGLKILKRTGERIAAGEAVAEIFHRGKGLSEAKDCIDRSFGVFKSIKKPKLICAYIDQNGAQVY